jgi:hypothetical protein
MMTWAGEHRGDALDRGKNSAYCDHEVTTMATMKQVGVREFRDHATRYLSGSETIAVSKNGRIIGIYVPMKRDEEKVRRAVDRLSDAVNRVLQETGMTEDELADVFDISKPLPE